MRFKYTAAQPNGRIVEGFVDVRDSGEALEVLVKQGFRPMSLKVIKSGGFIKTKQIGGGSITTADKVFLTKYLALMLKVGTDLFKAIDILIGDFEKPAMKSLLMEIRATLERGQPFYSTFMRHPKHFSSVFINMVRAGESSGNLEAVFSDLSTSLQREQELRNQIKSAMTYPIILLSASVLIVIFLITFALPKIANVFLTSSVEPPLFSRVVFAIGLFLNKYIWIIVAFLAVIVGGGIIFFSKNKTGRKYLSHFLARAPLVGKVIQKMAIQRFASTFSSLLKAGLPILEAMEITAGAVGSEEVERALLRVSREGVAKGLTIGDAFRKETVFPRVVTNLVAISEKAGHIEDILKTLAEFYESEIQSAVKSLVTILEPVMLLFIGVGIGSIALAVIVPVYQLVGQF